MRSMCRGVFYRKHGNLYQCIRRREDGSEEVLFAGTVEEIREELARAGFPPVSRAVLEEDLMSWTELQEE